MVNELGVESTCVYFLLYTCTFVVPFDEDQRNLDVWFLDHSYLENMAAMFRKVNCK